MALEEEFGFEIPDNEADKIDAINVAVDFIASHPQAKWDFYQWGMLIDLFVRFFMRPSLSVLMTRVIWKFWFHHMLMITRVLRFEIIWYSWPSTVGSFLLRYLTCWRWFAFATSLVNMLCFAMFFFPFFTHSFDIQVLHYHVHWHLYLDFKLTAYFDTNV